MGPSVASLTDRIPEQRLLRAINGDTYIGICTTHDLYKEDLSITPRLERRGLVQTAVGIGRF